MSQSFPFFASRQSKTIKGGMARQDYVTFSLDYPPFEHTIEHFFAPGGLIEVVTNNFLESSR